MKNSRLHVLGCLILSCMLLYGQKKVKSSSESLLIYKTSEYQLYSDKIVQGKDVAKVEKKTLVNAFKEHILPDLKGDYPKIETGIPMFDMMYKIALLDLENCNLDTHFRISPDFPRNAIFTRDIAYSSVLGANFVMPSAIKKHLNLTRLQRKEIGYKTPPQHFVPFLGKLNQVTNAPLLSGEYENSAIAKRTDDICWILGYYAALCVNGERSEFEWLIREFDYFDNLYYSKFRDPETGLYRGQSSFIDIGGTGYPKGFTFQQSVMIKALSTNTLYVRAFDILANVCEYLGDKQRASEFKRRALELKECIVRKFLHEEGYYAYFLHENNQLEPRREQLGMAFLVLFDILSPANYGLALDNYPSNAFGEPLLWPFYPNTKTYHNKSIWPFANTFFNWAQFKQTPADSTILRPIGNLARNMLWGNYTEVMDYETGGGNYKHARSYIWSASSYLAVIYNMLLGISFDTPDVIRFTPYLPNCFSKGLDVHQLKFGNTIINLSIKGNGRRISSFKVDGSQKADFILQKDGKTHLIEIELTND